MPNVRAVVGSNTVKARVGSQNAVRILSNASSPPTNLIDLNDVNSTLRTEDGMLLVWDFPSQQFVMTNVIDSTSLTISNFTNTYYRNTDDNILGDPDTGSIQIDGGVGIAKNLTVGAGLSVASSLTFNTGYIVSPVDNILGNPDTGSLQVDGGVGIAKNLTVGGGFYVQGASEFIGVATFRGGTINLGDSDTDDINVGGEFVSSLVPNDDASYDLGIDGKRWRNGFFSGDLSISGSLSTIDSLNVTGPSTFGGPVDINSSVSILGTTSFEDDIDVDGNLQVVGFVTLTDALYYGVGTYDGPNGIAYFDNDGKLTGAASTESPIDTSNYILTTEAAGINPVWTTTIDGGVY